MSFIRPDSPAPGHTAGDLETRTDWYSRIDEVVRADSLPDASPQDTAVAFKEIPKAERLQAIRYALDLLPDEKFSAMDGILFDPSADPAILDVIFSDVLNRTDALKYPAMRKILTLRGHPLAFESARILDATDPE